MAERSSSECRQWRTLNCCLLRGNRFACRSKPFQILPLHLNFRLFSGIPEIHFSFPSILLEADATDAKQQQKFSFFLLLYFKKILFPVLTFSGDGIALVPSFTAFVSFSHLNLSKEANKKKVKKSRKNLNEK